LWILRRATPSWFLNTHWDHISQPAREKSAALILDRAEQLSAGFPLLVMGDMNADKGNPALATLMGGTGSLRLIDTYRMIHPGTQAGTYTGFRTDSDGGERKIDYVLAGPAWRIIDADIDRRKIDGRYPSDHFPVWAELEFD
jgi:endonuclease/exonuclease/phosphatase family metal-dependent hydrolase